MHTILYALNMGQRNAIRRSAVAPKLSTQSETHEQACCRDEKADKKPKQWKKPVLEDVSGKVMAQPYIRFT